MEKLYLSIPKYGIQFHSNFMLFQAIQAGRYRWIEQYSKYFFIQEIFSQVSVYIISILNYFTCLNCTQYDNVSYLKYQLSKPVLGLLIGYMVNGLIIAQEYLCAYLSRYKFKHTKWYWVSLQLTLYGIKVFSVLEVFLINMVAYQFNWNILQVSLMMVFQSAIIMFNNAFYSSASSVYFNPAQIMMPIQQYKYMGYYSTILITNIIFIYRPFIQNYFIFQILISVLYIVFIPHVIIYYDLWSNLFLIFISSIYFIVTLKVQILIAIIIGVINIIRFLWYSNQLSNNILRKMIFLNFIKSGYIGKTRFHNIFQFCRKTMYESSEKLNIRFKLFYQQYNETELSVFDDIFTKYNYPYFLENILRAINTILSPLNGLLRAKKQRLQLAYNVCLTRDGTMPAVLQAVSERYRHEIYRWYTGKLNVIEMRLLQLHFNTYLHKLMFLITLMTGHLYYQINQSSYDDKRLLEAILDAVKLDIIGEDFSQITIEKAVKKYQQVAFGKNTMEDYEFMYWLWAQKSNIKLLKSQILHEIIDYNSYITKSLWIDYLYICLVSTGKNIKIEQKQFLQSKLGDQIVHSNINYKILSQLDQTSTILSLLFPWLQPDVKTNLNTGRKMKFDVATGKNIYIVYSPQKYYDFEKEINIFCNGEHHKKLDLKLANKDLQKIIDKVNQQSQLDVHASVSMAFDDNDDENEEEEIYQIVQQSNFQKIERYLQAFSSVKSTTTSSTNITLDPNYKIANTKVETQEYKNIQAIGFNIKHLHMFSLTQLLDLINNVILKNYKIQNSQALINKVYVDHYKAFSYYVLGFWKLWYYYDADSINYQLIVFSLDLILQNFNNVDKAFNKTFKKQKEYLLLCAYKQFHQDFRFNSRQYQKLSHQLQVYEKLKQKQERNPFAQKNQSLKVSLKNSFYSNSNAYSNISELISRINTSSSDDMMLGRQTPAYRQSQFFNQTQKYKKMLNVKQTIIVSILSAVLCSLLCIIQMIEVSFKISEINNYVQLHESSLKFITYQNQILSNSMFHSASNVQQYKKIINDIIQAQINLNFKHGIRTNMHKNFININSNLYQTDQLGSLNSVVNNYEVFYILTGSALQTIQLNYNDSLNDNGNYASMVVQELIKNSNLFSYMFQYLKSSIITSICVNITVNNFTEITLISVLLLAIIMFMFYILQYFRVHDVTEILRFVRNTKRSDIDLVTRYYSNLFYQTKKIQVDKIQCISGYNSRMESRLQSKNVSQHFESMEDSSNSSNSEDILNERIKQLEKLDELDQKQQERLHNYRKIKDHRLNNRFIQKNKTTLRILIGYLVLFIASFLVLVQAFSVTAHYKIQLNNYNRQIKKLPSIEIFLNQFKSKITSTIEYVLKYPNSDIQYQTNLLNQIQLLNSKNEFNNQINMLYTNYALDSIQPPNVLKRVFSKLIGHYQQEAQQTAQFIDRDEILNYKQLLKLNKVLNDMIFQINTQTDVITNSLLEFENVDKVITFTLTNKCTINEYYGNTIDVYQKVQCAIYSDQFLQLINSVLMINPFSKQTELQYNYQDQIVTIIATVGLFILDAVFIVFLYFNIKVVIEIYGSMTSRYPYVYILFITLAIIKTIVYVVIFRQMAYFNMTIDKQNKQMQNNINLLSNFVTSKDLYVYINKNLRDQPVDYPNVLEYEKQKFNYIDIILQFKHLFLDQNQVYFQEIKNYKTSLEKLNNPVNKYLNLYEHNQIMKKIFDYQVMKIQLNSVDFFYGIYAKQNETIRVLIIFLYPTLSYIIFTFLLNEIMYIKYWDRYCNFSTSKQVLCCKDVSMELKQIGQQTQNNQLDIKLNLDNNFSYKKPKIKLILSSLPLVFIGLLFFGYNLFQVYINDKTIRQQELESEGTNFLQELLIKYQYYLSRQYMFKQQDPNFISNATIMESMEYDAYQVKLIHSFLIGSLNKYYLSTLSYQKYGEQQNIYMLPNQLTNQAIISRNYLLDNYQVIQPAASYYQKYFISAYTQNQIKQTNVHKLVNISACSIFNSITPINNLEMSQVTDFLSSLSELLDNCTYNSSCNNLKTNLGQFYCGVLHFYEQNNTKQPYPAILIASLETIAFIFLVIILFVSDYFGFYRFMIRRLKIYLYMFEAICNKHLRFKYIQ